MQYSATDCKEPRRLKRRPGSDIRVGLFFTTRQNIYTLNVTGVVLVRMSSTGGNCYLSYLVTTVLWGIRNKTTMPTFWCDSFAIASVCCCCFQLQRNVPSPKRRKRLFIQNIWTESNGFLTFFNVCREFCSRVLGYQAVKQNIIYQADCAIQLFRTSEMLNVS